ncbi:DUF1367 family protein [Escherichia coli]
MVFIPLRWGPYTENQFIYTLYVSLNNWHLLHCAIERLRNGAYTTGQTNFFGLLLPATPESCDFLHQIKIGEWIHVDFKRVRNYAFHSVSNSCNWDSITGLRSVGQSRLANENCCLVSLITCANQLVGNTRQP